MAMNERHDDEREALIEGAFTGADGSPRTLRGVARETKLPIEVVERYVLTHPKRFVREFVIAEQPLYGLRPTITMQLGRRAFEEYCVATLKPRYRNHSIDVNASWDAYVSSVGSALEAYIGPPINWTLELDEGGTSDTITGDAGARNIFYATIDEIRLRPDTWLKFLTRE